MINFSKRMWHLFNGACAMNQINHQFTQSGLAATALHPYLGAEVSGVDLRYPLEISQQESINSLLTKYKVLVFRDQDITREMQIEFGRQFGELEIYPTIYASIPKYPEMLAVYNGAENRRTDTNRWHSDMTGIAEPTAAVILRAIEVPDIGGDTLFADMAAAYRGLPEAIKERIDNLIAVHDEVRFSQDSDEESKRIMAENFPPQEHPIVITHPESGEKILFVNAALTDHIKDMDRTEGDRLLAYLCAQAAVPEYQLRVRWRPNTVVFWDNISTQHYASADYWPAIRRLERIAIAKMKRHRQ